MIRISWNVGKIPRMRKQCVPGLFFRERPGNEARFTHILLRMRFYSLRGKQR